MRGEKQWREWLLKRAKHFCQCEVDAEDLVQEVLLAFWRKHNSVLPWDYSDEEEAKPHCLRLLKDKWIEHRRKLSSQREVLQCELGMAWEYAIVQTEQDVVAQVHWAELKARLEHMLSPCQQQILAFLVQGLDYSEIAMALGMSEGTVKSQIARIREKARILQREM